MPKCAAACRDGLRRKFCMAVTGIRADFDIACSKTALFEPIATCAPAAAPPSLDIECNVVQHQCDYLHPCNIFTIRAISMLIPRILFCSRLVLAADYLTQQYGQNSPPFGLRRQVVHQHSGRVPPRHLSRQSMP